MSADLRLESWGVAGGIRMHKNMEFDATLGYLGKVPWPE